MSWDFGDIRNKVRKLVGRLTNDDLSDNDLDNYINNYLHYTFPAEVKLDSNLFPYKFLTVKGQQNYPFPENFTNFLPFALSNGLDMRYFVTDDLYRRAVSQYTYRKVLGVGDGVLTNFSQGAQNQPILPGSVIVTDDQETFTDNGIGPIGTLTGNLGGTGQVTYATGAVNVNFNTAPALNNKIYISYVNYQSGQPQVILSFNSQFKVYPIPDSTYQIDLVGYKMPDNLVNGLDTPLLQEWGPAIAYGTAIEIFADLGEMDRVAEMDGLYKRQLKYVNRRDIQNTMYRSATRSN